jgi:ribosomal protein S18 acetylase RimI-like enzyme
MHIRTFTENDLAQVLDLTIETFGPFFEESFRPLMGDLIYTNQHADWRDDYRREVPKLHDPDQHKYVAVAESDRGDLAGYVAWSVDLSHRNGEISHLAVAATHRRQNLGATLCEHAFTNMRSQGAEVVMISTGGDPFHAPARALYESLQCTALPVAVYYRQL